MNTKVSNFGTNPYSRKSFNDLSNLIQRAWADSFKGAPGDLRETALQFNPIPVCYYCGTISSNEESTNPTDHIYPVSAGGISVPGNFGYICQLCNAAKGALHPLIYWDKRKSAGQPLWLEDRGQFQKWLYTATAPFRENYPEIYEIASRLEQTPEDRAFLMEQWGTWLEKNYERVDLSSENFWFSEPRIARAEHLRAYLEKIFPQHQEVAESTRQGYMVKLGLLVDLFGEDSESILQGTYPFEKFMETIDQQILNLRRDKGRKNFQAEKLQQLRNAIIQNSYGVNLPETEKQVTKRTPKVLPTAVLQAEENCRVNNNKLQEESNRLATRVRHAKRLAKMKEEVGDEEASLRLSDQYWRADPTTKGDLRSAARAAGVVIGFPNVQSLFEGGQK